MIRLLWLRGKKINEEKIEKGFDQSGQLLRLILK